MNIYFVTVSLLHENMRHAAGLHSDTNIVIAESEDDALSIMRNLFRPYILNDDSVFIAKNLNHLNAVQRGNGNNAEKYLNFPNNVPYDTLSEYLDILKDHYDRYEYHIYDKSGEVKILNGYLRDLKATSFEPASPVLPYDAEDSSTIPESYVKMIREQHDAVMTLLNKIDANTDEVEHKQDVINANIDEESAETRSTMSSEFDATRQHITNENSSLKAKIGDEFSTTRNKIETEESLTRETIEDMKDAVSDKLTSVDTSVNAVKSAVNTQGTAIKNSIEKSSTDIMDKIEAESINIQTKLDTQNEELKSTVSDMNTNIGNKLSEIKSTNSDIKTSVESIDTKVSEVKASVDSVSNNS